MCGIVCYLSFNGNRNDMRPILNRMAQDINHRGPDDEGYYINKWVGLGFKRLSILDTSSNGHQPMTDKSGKITITLNGEIYNYKGLRRDLVNMGFDFKSETDTEVVLNGYIKWGTGIFGKLQGMFAVIIHDFDKDEVIIARDHLGVKPLYYHKSNDFALFSSEIKSFRHKMKFDVNDKKLYEQLIYGYVSGEDTIFKNVYRVLPGTYQVFNSVGVKYTNEFYNVVSTIKTKRYVEYSDDEIEDAIDQSIFDHTVSDVGYNIQLSGGVDSSYITAVLAKKFDQKLKTFSVTMENFDKDESKYQEFVAKKYSTEHFAFIANGRDLHDNYEKATWHHDIPMVHPASVFLMLLSKYSREHSKVILTGEGADELFSGYSRYNYSKKYELYSQLAKHPKLLAVFPNISKINRLTDYLQNTEFGIDEAVYFSVEKQYSLTSKLEKDLTYRKNNTKDFSKLIHKIIASDQTSYLNWLFERQDKMSMAMGVESRVPFSNHKLFNMMNSIDPSKKIIPQPKGILKRISKKYFDDSFIYRRKNGFVLPYGDWLRDKNSLRPWFDLLTDKTFAERGFYNVNRVNKIVDGHLYKGEDNSKYLLNLISFEIWHRMFIN